MSLNPLFQQEGAVKPDSLSVDSYEHDLSAKRTTDIPTNMQMRADYDVRTDGQPVYLGFAPQGLATSNTHWLLHKFTYDGSDRVTVRQISYNSWDNHASASYS